MTDVDLMVYYCKGGHCWLMIPLLPYVTAQESSRCPSCCADIKVRKWISVNRMHLAMSLGEKWDTFPYTDVDKEEYLAGCKEINRQGRCVICGRLFIEGQQFPHQKWPEVKICVLCHHEEVLK